MVKIPVQLLGAQLPFMACIETRFPGKYGEEVVTAGTGTLIGPRLLLTAGHVVYDPHHGGMPLGFQVTMGSPRLSFSISGNNWRSSKPWFDKDSGLTDLERSLSGSDFGVVILDSPIDCSVSPLDFQTTRGASLSALELFVAGSYNQAANVRNDAFIASSQGTVMKNFDWRLTYQVRTLGGMSGGPVWSRDPETKARTIRAIHTSIFFGVGNALRIDTNVFKKIDMWRTQFHPSAS